MQKTGVKVFIKTKKYPHGPVGGVAQMVERSLSMREVPGSIPGASKFFFAPRYFAFTLMF